MIDLPWEKLDFKGVGDTVTFEFDTCWSRLISLRNVFATFEEIEKEMMLGGPWCALWGCTKSPGLEDSADGYNTRPPLVGVGGGLCQPKGKGTLFFPFLSFFHQRVLLFALTHICGDCFCNLLSIFAEIESYDKDVEISSLFGGISRKHSEKESDTRRGKANKTYIIKLLYTVGN